MPDLPQTSQTRLRVSRARELLVRGYTRMEIQASLIEEFGVCARSARNTMRHLDSVLIHESSNRRRVNQHRQLAKLSHTIQVALERVKFFAHEGKVTDERPEPNVGAAIEAIKEQNRILGLNLPDLDDGEAWAGLPMVMRPLPAGMDRDSTPTPSNGRSNGSTTETSPYSRPNGSS